MDRTPSLEDIFVEDFGVRTAMPLQRAICRIADRRQLGELAEHPDVLEGVGRFRGPAFHPKTMLLACAIRSGKSQMAGAAAVRCAESCDLSVCSAGDLPRVAIVSTHKDQARVVMDHLLGAFRSSPRLRSLLVEEPSETQGILMRHPTGRPIEIKVVAGSRAGASLAARFLVCAIFDEAAKMVGAEEGVVNLDHERRNVAGRLLSSRCCPEWLISSPWAPFGPFYGLVMSGWQKPTRDLVVVRARGDRMNPVWWTPERIADLQRNPDAYRTDYLAEFADPDAALIPGVHIDAAVRPSPLVVGPELGWEYAAEMDPAVRTNAWTLIVTRRLGRKTQVVLAHEWQGKGKTDPLKSKEVFAQMRDLLAPYPIAYSAEGRRRVGSDQHAVDILREIAVDFGIDVVEFPSTRAGDADGYLTLARRFELGEIEVPNVPNLVSDLRRLRRVTTQGSVRVDLPLTSDGRHCDYAPSLMRAADRNTVQPPVVDQRPTWKIEQEKSIERAIKKHVPGRDVPWWKKSA